MDSKLIDIPNNELDEIINQNIEQSNKVLIVVSFIFEKVKVAGKFPPN